MARPDIAEVRLLNDADLIDQINGCRRELFDLRFQRATRRLEHPHRFKQSRIKLAQLLTVQKERQRSALTAS
ncbi:50S ribosomal protein L29 [Synechococcus sp. CS-602]|uniref:50S ribosomal protein L29 n=1 Tax=Synechococcaceae TaxID=1890426 RepID=UPI0008FF4BC5|nr:MULTISPECIES: 50S ribosomal protein L29 [Synechococcaceae]MCT4365347.1 50S ribosomal protein L29 [Candidatus Regnicoccus frigidus MAG-AL1]APD48296.1 50S ribosomal protein L29 [Synechococcus sp. SynAce01]MCT0201541.1 50S ribosomal protein L29 [Synechococcus sp. CS-603]MCT0206048.1 50S ribosomal protein L29 [Synechococcus sp. CS-602]MCT0244972.1 50S ribosomal protein L29 [Synechococcus sp. CS-601]